MSVQLLIPAAGMGLRLGGGLPKALALLAGRPLLTHTLDRLRPLGLARNAIVLVSPPHRALFATAIAGMNLPEVRVVDGGDTRQASVQAGLDALDAGTTIVVIHDAARPFVPLGAVTASIEAARAEGAATVAIPAVDTILEGTRGGYLDSTPDRSLLWQCQTPQTFRVELIREAHARARAEGFEGTDDASLVRRLGTQVRLVPGSPLNFKITTPADLAFARAVIQEELA